MPKIEIVEHDLTSPGRNSESTDIAYIPGFVDVTNNFTKQEYKNVIGINKPTLFTDVASFETMCGKKAPKFSTTQYYKDIGGMGKGFANEAVPYSGVMFAADDLDPSYVMAKELLSQGLNVLYERVNPDIDLPEYTTLSGTQPEDWAQNYTNYEEQKEVYTDCLSASMPEFFEVANGKVYSSSNTYYTRSIKNITIDDVTMERFVYVATTIDSQDIDNGVIKSTGNASKVFYLALTTIPYYLRKPVSNDTSYVADKYYQRKPGAQNNYQIITGDSPADWPTGAYEFTLQEIKEVTEDTVTYKTYSNEWIEKWATDGVVKDTIWDKNISPTFDSSKTYRVMVNGINIKTMYNALSRIFDAGSSDGLMDKGNYSFKYMTTGGYPVYEYNSGALVQKMLNVAYNRGDCVAIIDHTDNVERTTNIDHVDSLYAVVQDDESWKSHGEFGAMFTPWATYNRTTFDGDINTSDQIRLPASFAYLAALADSIKTNANWLAIAGAARGSVLHLADEGMTTIIPNGAADRMQPRNGVAINPITNINPYGNVIWGNRTLKDNATDGNLTATSFLNIRNLVSDVKKQCYTTARQLTFEQNNDVLWTTFKALMSPLLDTMLSGYGISGYKIVKDLDKQRELGNPKATLCVKIVLHPVYAVEDFYISIVLKDDEVSVNE